MARHNRSCPEQPNTIQMKKITLLIAMLTINVAFCQKRFENKQYGFSIEEPHNWQIANNDETLKNLDKYDLTDEAVQELLKKNKGSILLTSFYKYEAHKHAGLIPTIKINMRENPIREFAAFKSMVGQSSKGFVTVFPDFTYIQEPTEIEISGIKSVFFSGKYTMKAQNGTEMKIKSRTCAIPYGNYFFQVNFIDGQTKDDCTAEFDALVKTIKIEPRK